ncbi:unnamed protein product [Brugia pahangi]|uniref:ZP domain-containing protein n=1 Tax=Brugia pahangi TaxID=6280 RepID=A0A0N4T4H3_BRUPA|nr:unnamed protein product [Brugia pahangi]
MNNVDCEDTMVSLTFRTRKPFTRRCYVLFTIVVTRTDRAYRCMCFFRNIKRLTSDVDMSSIGITELMDAVQMPICTYKSLDLDRCVIDPIIQPDVKYDGDLKKVKDTSVLNYQCVVECKKSAGECESLTPPTRTSNSRIRRSVVDTILEKGAHDISDLRNSHQIDLVATISMLDNIEENGASDSR